MSIQLLKLSSIGRTFEGTNQAAVLRNIDLEVYEGDFLAIEGPSGAGKSTLLNIAGLLDVPTVGSYQIFQRETSTLLPRERDDLRAHMFGFVFQSSHVLPFESVAYNAALGLLIQGAPRRSISARVKESLEQVGLLDKVDQLARDLSGGERQRLAIARALATRPTVILADEPTGNLDSRNTQVVMKLFSDLNDQGVTVIVITHDRQVSSFARRTVRVVDGQLSEPVSTANSRPITFDYPKESKAARSPQARAGAISALFRRASDALNSLTSRPTRSLALIAAFVVGTGGLVAASGLAATTAQQVSDQLSKAALDEVSVFSPAGTALSKLENHAARIDDLRYVKGVGIRMDVEAVDARVSTFAPGTTLNPTVFDGTTLGADASYLHLVNARTVPADAGRLLSDANAGRVALVGAKAAAMLGISASTESAQIWVRGRPYTVIGVIRDPGRIPSLASSVVVPISTLPALASSFFVRTDEGYPAAVASAIPAKLAPGNPGSVTVSTTANLRNLSFGVASDLSVLVAVSSAILLAMAIFSAATAMFLSVQSRTQELALRRALGLGRGGALSIFLLEGSILGFAGGLAGVALGLICTVICAATQHWTAVIPPSAIVIGLVAGLIGGAASALWPAVRASRVEPAQAIR